MPGSDLREVELKLELDPTALQRIRSRRLKGMASDEIVREKLTATYFDTKKLSLQQKGLSLRIRVEGDRRIQTLKASREGGSGVFDRWEWSTEVAGDEPDLAKIESSPFGTALLAKPLRGRLMPVFKTEIDRTRCMVRSHTAEIEIALDEGQIVAGERSEPVAELELELKGGARSELFEVARSLAGAGGLKVGVLAKSERGYNLLVGDNAGFFKAEALFLEPGLRTEDAFKAIVHSCVRHFRRNEPFVIQTRTAEPLHQCRVALRRLRSGFSLFKDVIADDEVGDLKERLRSISQQLGVARDLDVFLDKLTKPRDDGVDIHAHDNELVEQARNDREEAYNRLIKALEGKRTQTLMFDVLAWTEAGPWLADADPLSLNRREMPVERFAAEVLERRRRKLRKRGGKLEELDPPARHKVRIEAKKLRYATEFFASLVSTKKNRKRHKAFSTALAALQEHLGELNDLATQDDLVRGAGNSSAREAIADVFHHGQRERDKAVKRSLKAASSASRQIAKAKPFWETGFSHPRAKG